VCPFSKTTLKAAEGNASSITPCVSINPFLLILKSNCFEFLLFDEFRLFDEFIFILSIAG